MMMMSFPARRSEFFVGPVTIFEASCALRPLVYPTNHNQLAGRPSLYLGGGGRKVRGTVGICVDQQWDWNMDGGSASSSKEQIWAVRPSER
jgi:hypothetical protein